jgi:hypothetical protein
MTRLADPPAAMASIILPRKVHPAGANAANFRTLALRVPAAGRADRPSPEHA